ncbi:hypothetical protein [Legionella hackeliae]|uniref:Interaptin n=1 Tax=Legionella hackeliae TaxID=449 RepID=A0A0A8UM20_LEGHA|nr:hypothetical protein [Legionella hackeliae]KTD10295.1 interaptin [Legionella hackeliae]CEK09793.1 protein of unknown function [Legionella hackeliae]STX49703.1 interaptin [Legionella hackeliae]
MPILNDRLLLAINERALASKPQALPALNAILSTDPGNANAFRQAILNNQAVWNNLGASNFDTTGHGNNNNFLTLDGDLGLGGGPTVAQNFSSLFKAAAIRRVKLGLSQMNEQALTALINEGTAANARNMLVNAGGRILVGQPATTIHGWAAAPVLDDPAITEIQLEAQRILLAQKIAASTNQTHIDALLNANDDLTLRNAVKALGIPDATAQRMTHATLHRLVTVDAAKKGYQLHLASVPPLHLVNAFASLQLGDVQFMADVTVVPALYRAPLNNAPEDITWVREQFGKKYLEEYYAKHLDRSELDDVASQPDVTAQKAYLKTANADDAYLNAAVTDKNLPSLRQVAATQSLSLKIAEINDVETLDALTKIANVQDVKRLLSTSDTLGYKANLNFQNAFIDAKSAQQIAAAASVRKHLLVANDPVKLQQLLNSTNPSFKATWEQFTGTPASAGVENYFKNPDNVTRAKQQALQQFTKLTMSDATLTSNEAVRRMVTATNPGELQAGVRVLLGGTHNVAIPHVDNLITDLTHDFERKLKAYAAVEATLRVTKEIDLSGGNLAAFKAKINALNIIRPTSGHRTGIAGAAATLDGATLDAVNVGAAIASLSQKEKEEFRGRLVETLINRHPDLDGPTTQNFKNLVDAKDFRQFKQALTAIGITSNDWVTKESMAAVQTAAAKKLIRANLANYSNVGPHGALLNLVEKLPLAKQQGIVANPDVIRSIMDAHSSDPTKQRAVIQRVLGDDVNVNDPSLAGLVDALAAENLRNAYAAKIINSKVAEIIGNQPQALTLAQIDAINTILLDPTTDLRGPPAAYKTAIDRITAVLALPVGGLNAAFGYNPVGPAVDALIQGPIDAQRQRNQDLNVKYHGRAAPPAPAVIAATASEKVALEFLMGLNKSAAFPNNNQQVANAITAFKQSATPSAFIQELVNAGLVNSAANPAGIFTLESLKKQITPELFADAKINANKKQFLDSPQQEVTTEIERLKTERRSFEDLHKKITASDKKIQGQLKQLAETRAIDWLSPGFQATARQNAREMLDTYKELDNACDSMVQFFANEKALLEKQKASIPQASDLPATAEKWRKDKLAAARAEIDKQLRSVEKELSLYQGVQKLLRGDPTPDPTQIPGAHPAIGSSLKRQGLLKTLEAAMKGEDIKFFGIYSSITDYPIEQKKSLLGTKGTDTVTMGGGVVIQTRKPGPGLAFELEKPIPQGCLRNHTIGVMVGGNQVQGRFLEERGPDVAETTKDGKVKYSADYTITSRDIPPVVPAGPNNVPPANKTAQREYYMAMAMQALKGLNGPPSKDNPIYLGGSDPEAVKGAWLALMVIGQNDPNMKFSSDAIKVQTPAFRASEHLRKWPLETVTDPEYKELVKYHKEGHLETMKELSKAKFGKEAVKVKEQDTKAAKQTADHFRGEMKDGRQEVDQKNKEVQTTQPNLSGIKAGG